MINKTSMVKWSFYIPRNMKSDVTNHAESTGLSASDVIRLAIKEYVKKHKLP